RLQAPSTSPPGVCRVSRWHRRDGKPMPVENTINRNYERDLTGALCFEHGYVGSGVKRLLSEWTTLMKTKAGREAAFDRLEQCAELLKLNLDELSVWYANYLDESGQARQL